MEYPHFQQSISPFSIQWLRCWCPKSLGETEKFHLFEIQLVGLNPAPGPWWKKWTDPLIFLGGVSSESRENKHKDTIRIAEEIITDGIGIVFFFIWWSSPGF